MAAPFSITKLLGLGILVVVMLMIALPMIQQAFTPAGTNSTTPSNVVCTKTINASTLNTLTQYQNAQCLIETLYGPNSSLTNNSQYGHVFNLTQTTAFGGNQTNSSTHGQTGFFVNIFAFTGLSFVFSGIGTIIKVMETLGQVAQVLFLTLWYWLPPFESLVIVNVIKLIVFYIYIRIILLGISAWMKFDLISN